MLSSLRRGASSWIIKAFLAVLVASFVLWGVADVFKGYGTRAVATVAGHEIQPEQFQQAFESDFQRIQQQYGSSITREMARKIGLESQTLTRLVSEAVLDAHARDLKLGINDQAVLDTLKQDPTFQGANGEFSRDIFANLLRANNLTEQGFFSLQRASQVRGQIASATQAGQFAPAAAVNALNRYRNETRVVSYFPLPPDKAPAPAEPDEAQLKAQYEAGKSRYSSPEYRKVSLLTLDPAAYKKPGDVTEDEVKAAYEQKKATFGSPEKRVVQMLSFKDMAAAEKGAKDLKAGKDFLALGKELGLKEGDINLGEQTKAGMVDPAIAEAAFSLKKGEISKPVQGPFAVVIVRPTEVTPGVEKTFEQVKGEIRESLAKEKALNEAQALQDKIENARSRGASLKELAEKYTLKLQEIPAIDQEGQDPEGKPVADVIGGPRVLPKAFATEVGVESEGLELGDGLMTWVDVQGVTPAAVRPFDTIKDQVKNDVIASERRKALQELAQKLVERAGKGETLEALAKEMGQKVTQTQPVKRQDSIKGIAASGVPLAFSLAKGAVAQADAGEGARALLRVDAITVPAEPDKAQAEALSAEIVKQLTDDVATQYMTALQSRYDARINRDAVDRVMGRTAQ